MIMINAVKEFKTYKNSETNALNKSVKMVKYDFKPYDYELESYIKLWLKKNKITLECEYVRTENENEIIIEINTVSTISKSLRIDKTKLFEVKT